MPSIAIVGAGPAGLTLARLLLVSARDNNLQDLQLTIFENDASSKARWQQGGTLDLHTETGIAALKAAGMWDDILPHMRYEGEELIFADMNATTFVHMKGEGSKSDSKRGSDHERPEVDREVLKDYLLEATEKLGGKGIVRWGKHLVKVDESSGVLEFRDGSVEGPFDLVVGADGAWSKVRNLLTDVKPSYSGVCGFEMWIDEDHSNGKWQTFNDFVGRGSFFSYGKKMAVMAQRQEDGNLKASVWVQKDQSWPAELAARCGHAEDKIRQAILEEYSDWDEQIKDLLRAGWHYREWPLFELPIGHSWKHRPGFTLIGDSAHLMTPFAGEGVNAAMKDALELANAITASLTGKNASLDHAIEKFEQDMFPRSKDVQSKTARNKNSMFTDDAPVSFLGEVPVMLADEFGYNINKWWMSMILFPFRKLAYTYFWLVSRYGSIQRQRREKAANRRVGANNHEKQN